MARVFLLDKSGSMDSVLDDTIGGFNSFVRSQVSLGGTLSLYTFSDKCQCVYKDVPIEDVKPLTKDTYVPEGCTALYDAMGKVLSENDKGTLVVLTDGQENSSKKYTKSHVKDLVRLLSPTLQVLYVGVDLEDATELGVAQTMQYTPERTPDIFRSVSESVASNVLRQTQSQPSERVRSKEANDSNTRLNTYPTVPTTLPF